MKTLALLIFILSAAQAYADPIQLGCAVATYDCYPGANGQTVCSWGYDIGGVSSVELQKTGTGPSYEIWEGKINGLLRKQFPYTVSIYQRREAKQNYNFLTANLEVGKVKVSGMGQNIVELHHLSESDNTGIGLRCTTDLIPEN